MPTPPTKPTRPTRATHDVAVIGAGPAGAMAAADLRRRGYSVLVLERSRFPRFVIGESMLPSCMNHLDAVGLLEPLADRGYLEKGGVGILEGDQIAEFDFAEQFTDGWSYTWQVKRAEFDQALIQEVEKLGAEVQFEQQVIGFTPGKDPTLRWKDVSENGGGTEHERQFRFVVDASGYGRVLARLLDMVAPSSLPPMRALFSHANTDRRPAGRRGTFSWAVCDGDLWTWVIPFADGTTSVGVVGALDAFDSLPADPAERLSAVIEREPNLAARMAGTTFAFPPKQVEAYSANVTQLHGPGFCLVGNAGEFLDPIFSSGISFAFATARLAGAAIDRQLQGKPIDWQVDFGDRASAGVDVFRDYVQWWYDGSLRKLFFGEAPTGIQKQICSVLAGYVWDDENTFVSSRRRKIPQLLRVLRAGRQGGSQVPTA